MDLFGQGGWPAVCPVGRGRERGQSRLLSDEQERLTQRAFIGKRPEQLKLDFYLWSRSAVAQLIEQEWPNAVGTDGRQIPQALGFYATKADQEGLRTTA